MVEYINMDSFTQIAGLLIAIGTILKINSSNTAANSKMISVMSEQETLNRKVMSEQENLNRETYAAQQQFNYENVIIPLINRVADNTKELTKVVKGFETMQGIVVNVFEEVNDLSKDVADLSENVTKINKNVNHIADRLDKVDFKTLDHDHVLSDLVSRQA